MNKTDSNYRAIQIATIIALVFGAYFLRNFFSLIIFAIIITFLFNPLYLRFRRRFKKKGTAASMTLIVSLLALVVPLALIAIATVYQIRHALEALSNNTVDFGSLGQQMVDWINNVTARIPGMHPITLQELQSAVTKIASDVAKSFLNALTSSVSGLTGVITNIIIYMYVFINLLVHQDSLIELIKRLNPLGRARTEIYLKKMGSMTKAMAKGQFIIATVQGFTDASLLYIAGLRSVFIFMFVILTVLSIIPLGGGIVVIPIGIVFLLTGHIWQGLLVLLGHFLIVTNEDNVLRPKLVPKESHLNPALTLLAVFAGVGMFGFLGIIIGPVIMILIVSTLQMYLDSKPSTHK
ncbi:MAG TPA: AI-2E family transporter [Candidatus Babeliales bacterium]|nr:AI-2E family transporter [Candidatus Babeliales bacterium]